MLLAFGVLAVWLLIEAYAADVRDREHTTWAQYTPGVLVVRAVRALNRLLDRMFSL